MTHALNLFGEIEQDDNYQDDIELSQCFHSLMSNVKEARQCWSQRVLQMWHCPLLTWGQTQGISKRQ